jgi:hypothetical protein
MNITTESHGFIAKPTTAQKVHVACVVVPACDCAERKVVERVQDFLRQTRRRGEGEDEKESPPMHCGRYTDIRTLVALTKVDELDAAVKSDPANMYLSARVQEVREKASAELGVPLADVLPIKNYSGETEVDFKVRKSFLISKLNVGSLQIDIPILLLLREALNAAKDLFRSQLSDALDSGHGSDEYQPPPYNGSTMPLSKKAK